MSLQITYSSIVQAESADIPALHELMREFYACERLDFTEAVRVALRHLVTDENLGYVLLLAAHTELAGRENIGYAVVTFGFSLEFGGRFALLDELYVREPYRNHGFGSQTLQLLELRCVQSGIETMRLEVDRVNAAAQSLYRKRGYGDHGRDFLTKPLAPLSETKQPRPDRG